MEDTKARRRRTGGCSRLCRTRRTSRHADLAVSQRNPGSHEETPVSTGILPTTVDSETHTQYHDPHHTIPDTRSRGYARRTTNIARIFSDPLGFQQSFSSMLNFLCWDLSVASEAPEGSPIKAAIQHIRDVREAIRAIVEFDGLWPEDRAEFFSVWAPRFNLPAGGPPVQRSEEWIALMRDGILRTCSKVSLQDSLVHHYYKTSAQVLPGYTVVKGNISARDPSLLQDMLVHSLLQNRLASTNNLSLDSGRPQVFGLRVNKYFSLLPANPASGAYCLRPFTEGSRFFMNILPSSDSESSLAQEAVRVVDQILRNCNCFKGSDLL